MGPCAGSDGDLLFEKNSVGLTRGEEFSYRPLFESGRQGTNGWKTIDYKHSKRRAIALGIMHILRPARTTYVTSWQVGFFKRILKGQRGITLPTSPVEEVRPEEGKKREAQLREKETECEVLQLNLEKESGRCAELEETCGGLRISNENAQKVTVDLMARLEKSREAYNAVVKRLEQLITTPERRDKMHVKELAKLEARRAVEFRIAEALRGKIEEAKTAEEDLRSKIEEIEEKCAKEF
ncbi:hypothetical protein AXG93_2891s1110 [Marchantia polymorpha subsp. ruderalis]|uniref:Uncharacterized protein n=1 Tax=Marchantia polymorpha subsp. ruderalis TaxID=1480154 RepID=A0A176WLP8_MARPO|nr:hypothetical protein AXG93_2891s1110 [Marchantia polymorpha subsp. ruderalis]